MNPEEKKVTALVPVEGERLPVSVPPKKETYWGRISSRYAVISRVLIVILLLFAVLFLLVFSRVFTYDSLFSFVKDLQNVSSFVPSNYETVYASYSGGETETALYRGSIAFVTGNGIEVYAPDGTRLLDVTRELKNPRVAASEKYLLAFDQGGRSFSVTNSYGELYRGESEFAILNATVADSGYFALITRCDEYISRVCIYDQNFNLVRGIDRGSATVGAAFTDENGIAILGAVADNGRVMTTVSVYDHKLESIEHSFTWENEMPLGIGLADDDLVILTDHKLRVCGSDGTLEREVALQGSPVEFAVCREGTVLVTETDAVTATHHVVALDEGGDTLYDGTYTGDVYAATVGDGELFLLCDGAALRMTPDGTVQTVAVDAGATDILRAGDHCLRVIYPAKAEFVDFENLDR